MYLIFSLSSFSSVCAALWKKIHNFFMHHKTIWNGKLKITNKNENYEINWACRNEMVFNLCNGTTLIHFIMLMILFTFHLWVWSCYVHYLETSHACRSSSWTIISSYIFVIITNETEVISFSTLHKSERY